MRQRQAQVDDREHARLHDLDKLALKGMMDVHRDSQKPQLVKKGK